MDFCRHSFSVISPFLASLLSYNFTYFKVCIYHAFPFIKGFGRTYVEFIRALGK